MRRTNKQQLVDLMGDWYGGQWTRMYSIMNTLNSGREYKFTIDQVEACINEVERDKNILPKCKSKMIELLTKLKKKGTI